MATAKQTKKAITSAGIPFVVDPSLAIGQLVIPARAVGDCSPELPVHFPSEWPVSIKEVFSRRGNRPVRLYADGEGIVVYCWSLHLIVEHTQATKTIAE